MSNLDALQAGITRAVDLVENGSDLDEPAKEAVRAALAALNEGQIRVAEKRDGEWVIHAWVQRAVLLYFRVAEMQTFEVGPYEFHDKIPLKTNLAAQGVRLVPPGAVRYGAFLEPGCVVMPGYVNLGAYVGAGTMVDTCNGRLVRTSRSWRPYFRWRRNWWSPRATWRTPGDY